MYKLNVIASKFCLFNFFHPSLAFYNVLFVLFTKYMQESEIKNLNHLILPKSSKNWIDLK